MKTFIHDYFGVWTCLGIGAGVPSGAAFVSDLIFSTHLVEWLCYTPQGVLLLLAAGVVVVTLAVRNGEIGGG